MKTKEKEISRIIILFLFILICVSRGIWFFFERYSANYENRQMAEKPVLTFDNYCEFSDEYTSYFNDNLQFRNNFITINSAIDYLIFNESSNEDVIIGKEGWLFYNSIGDGNPISDYKGESVYSNEDLQEIAQNLISQKEILESMGIEFVIFIAPNKERIYCEYMPEQYGEPAENYRVLQLYEYLKNNTDLEIIYPYADLMNVKNQLSENIWYKTDTHWNYLGGYIGAKALLGALDIDIPSICSDSIQIVRNGNTSGDLAGLLNLTKQLRNTDFEYAIEGYDKHNCEQEEFDFFGMWSFTATNADSRTIYVLRDSFASHMAQYIASQFSKSYFRHNRSYSYDDIAELEPDIFVYETVERYVDGLRTFAIY